MASVELADATYRAAAEEAALAGLTTAEWVAVAVQRAIPTRFDGDEAAELDVDDGGFPVYIPAGPVGAHR